MSPTDFGFAKLISMHDESFFANFAVLNVQPRFTVVLPNGCYLTVFENSISNILRNSYPYLKVFEKNLQS